MFCLQNNKKSHEQTTMKMLTVATLEVLGLGGGMHSLSTLFTCILPITIFVENIQSTLWINMFLNAGFT